MDTNKKVMSPLEVAKELGCCRKTVYTMLKNNELPYVKIGDMWAIPVTAFEKWLLECGRKETTKNCQ
jgi:excisionase family DNA binding protein